MTTVVVVVARGGAWGIDEISDGWGDATDQEIATMTSQAVGLFEEKCAARGDSSVAWYPSLSEVQADQNGLANTDADWDLAQTRDEAIEEIWDEWINS